MVVGFIGPLFWLGVQVLEAKFWLWLRNRLRDARLLLGSDYQWGQLGP